MTDKFIERQINKYADLPDNLEYETLDYKEVERRRRYAMLDKKCKLKRNIIICLVAITVAVAYAAVVCVVTLIIGLGA